MDNTFLIKNITVVNEGRMEAQDAYVKNGRIERIAGQIDGPVGVKEWNGDGKYLMPGVIDDQVHFREPGLTHKASIDTESRAAVAGGTTSFMEMPNTIPNATTIALLEDKYKIAAETSMANYSFYLGGDNSNVEELKRVDTRNVCGVKVFMGSSTGNMLVDDEEVLERIFAEVPSLIAIHSESECVIKENKERILAELAGREPQPADHARIRDTRACYESTVKATTLAKKHGTRLHVLHISTQDELILFSNALRLAEKRITAEACVHHLWFSAEDYARLGNDIKCNPSIKEARHREAVWEALMNGTIDVVATDHAPHSRAEKDLPFMEAPSGLPLVQHSLRMMLEQMPKRGYDMAQIAKWMSHQVAECFKVEERGYLREGYWADMVVVSENEDARKTEEELLYKCGWSPLAGQKWSWKVDGTWVNGRHVWDGRNIVGLPAGQRMRFKGWS